MFSACLEPTRYEIIILFVLNFLAMRSLAKYLKRNNQHKGLSFLNSSVLSLGSLLYFTFDNYFERPSELKTGHLKNYLIVLFLHTFAISYCLIDLSYNWVKINKSGKIHHFLMGFTLFVVIYFGLMKPTFLFFPIELSTIFLNLRNIFPKYSHSKDLATYCFVLTFVITRLLYLPYINYIIYVNYIEGFYLHMLYILSVIPLQGLQIFWIHGMIDKYVIKNPRKLM